MTDWKDTVMSYELKLCHSLIGKFSLSAIKDVVDEECLAQAEISFKAGYNKKASQCPDCTLENFNRGRQSGIKEVVEIAEPYLRSLTELIVISKNLKLLPTETSIKNIEEIWKIWKAKLEEWGYRMECPNKKNHVSAFPAYDRVKCPFCNKVYVRRSKRCLD